METYPITAPHKTGGTHRGVAALAVVGMAVGVACFAHAQTYDSPNRTSGHAATLGKPQPITDPQSKIITRGLAPEATIPGQPPGWMSQPSTPTVRPLIGGTGYSRSTSGIPETVPVKKPSFMDSTWSSLKDVVVGKPAPQSAMQPTSSARTAPVNTGYAPQQITLPNPAQNAGVYAGPPAYRWYGWGTTTPGLNPHAPNGQYPRGSTNWYTQTGATPGAFPVTVASNGTRVVANEPPAYAIGSTVPVMEPFFPVATSAPAYYPEPPTTTVTPVPVMTFPVMTQTAPVAPSMSMPMAAPQLSTQLPMPTPMAPSTTFPVNTVTVPSFTPIMSTMPTPPAFEAFPTPMIVPSSATSEIPVANGVNWQSATNTETVNFTPSQPTTVRKFNPPVPTFAPSPMPIAPTPSEWVPAKNITVAKPISRSQEPSEPTVVTLPAAIRNACYGWATVTEVNHIGPSKILIRLIAASDADARAASECISRLPQLKDFVVDFEAKIGSR